jgi:hypothetical protein
VGALKKRLRSWNHNEVGAENSNNSNLAVTLLATHRGFTSFLFVLVYLRGSLGRIPRKITHIFGEIIKTSGISSTRLKPLAQQVSPISQVWPQTILNPSMQTLLPVVSSRRGHVNIPVMLFQHVWFLTFKSWWGAAKSLDVSGMEILATGKNASGNPAGIEEMPWSETPNLFSPLQELIAYEAGNRQVRGAPDGDC